jgi:hypothetical protein
MGMKYRSIDPSGEIREFEDGQQAISEPMNDSLDDLTIILSSSNDSCHLPALCCILDLLGKMKDSPIARPCTGLGIYG